MGKKRKAGGKPHQTRSFEQLVGKANQEALKPFIMQQLNYLGMQLRQSQIRDLASIQMRIMALEKFMIEKLGITEDDLAVKVAELEDEATGLIQVTDRGAEAGDTLRATINVKTESQEDFGTDQRMQIDRLAQEPYTVTKDFEEQLLGLKDGETREVQMDEGKTLVKVKADRLSTPKVKPQPPAVAQEVVEEAAAQAAETQGAPEKVKGEENASSDAE